MGWSVPLGRVDLDLAAFTGRPDDPLREPEYAAMGPLAERGAPSVAGFVVRATTEFGSTRIGVHSGMVRENGTVLGSAGEGAFAFGNAADTAFTGLTFDARLGWGFSAFGGAEIGRTSVDAADGSLVTGLSGVTTTALNLGIAKERVFGDDDRLGLVLSQPLRVAGGRARLTLPTSRELDGTVHFTETSQEIAADGREIDLQLGYTVPVGERASVTAAGLLRMQPDNIRDAEPEQVFMIKYRLEF
jgi:hypothetical protein